MNQQAWASVEAHFDVLSKLAPDERAARLSEITDEEVRREVASLLANMGGETTFASVVGKMAAQIEASPPPGERIGPYKLVRRLARGGQGTVFEAVRDDGSFRQRVAIKMVKWEADSDESRRRFRSERQILAGLQHPNIARLLDGGETPDGTPYLVMEFIDGKPMQVAEGWPLKRKLELFLQVADAVSFAHRNLIVHRDLKPANILVTAEGAPKLLDFGIARLMDPEATRTRTGLIGLTPDYASPEQVRGFPISTATDVYSLGVVLYELLTSRKPYTLETATPLEMDRVIVNQPPAPPELGDELDHILLMALRKEPERRYQSVEAFAEDIQRYLDHRPIVARPDTIRYRTRKYVRRHWIPLTAATLTMAGLLGGATLAVYQARVAQRRFDQVRKLANHFLFDFDKEIATIPGTVRAREMIVSTALEYLDSLGKDARGDPELQWELASAYSKVAEVQGSNFAPSLNHPKDAIASAQKALSLARPLDDHGRLNAEQRAGLIVMLRNLQATLAGIGEFDQAVKIGEEQVARSAGLPLNVRDDSATVLATTYLWNGDLEKARMLFEESLRLSREIAAGNPSWINRARLAGSLREVGQVMWNLARLEEARALLLESIPMYRQCVKEEPGRLNTQRNLVISLDLLAQVVVSTYYPSLDQPAEGEPYYQEAIGMLEKRLKADPKDRSTQHDLGAIVEHAGGALTAWRPEKALEYSRRAVELRDASDDNPGEKAEPRVTLAGAHIALKQYGDAARRLEEAGGLVSAGDHEIARDIYLGWARLEQARGNLAQAADWCNKAAGAGEAVFKAKPIPENALRLARILELGAQVQSDTATARRRRILEIWQDQNGRFQSAYLQRQVAEAERNQLAQ